MIFFYVLERIKNDVRGNQEYDRELNFMLQLTTNTITQLERLIDSVEAMLNEQNQIENLFNELEMGDIEYKIDNEGDRTIYLAMIPYMVNYQKGNYATPPEDNYDNENVGVDNIRIVGE